MFEWLRRRARVKWFGVMLARARRLRPLLKRKAELEAAYTGDVSYREARIIMGELMRLNVQIQMTE